VTGQIVGGEPGTFAPPAHELGMGHDFCGATPAAQRHSRKDRDYHLSGGFGPGAGQSSGIVTIEADIIKQKLPENNGGYPGYQHGRIRATASSTSAFIPILASDHPIGPCAATRLANCFIGTGRLDQQRRESVRRE